MSIIAQTFNQKLVDENVEINIIDYVKLLNNESYHIDISFVDDFICLIGKDEFCISHDMLYKYGVLSDHNTAHVKTMMEQYKFVIGVDFLVNTKFSGNPKGGKPQYNYLLHPDAFKLCLMKSQKTDIYAKYYILLEKCIKYYSEYQILKLQDKMNNICVDRTIELKDNSKDETFVIALNNIYIKHQYTVIRGQKKNLCKVMKQLKLKSEDIICNIPCCYANNLYNKIKEVMKGYIIFQKKYLYINDDGNVEEWSYI